MNSRKHIFLALMTLCAILVFTASTALAQGPDGASQGRRSDNLKHPLGARQQALKQKALQAKLRGEPVGAVYEAEQGKYVETQHVLKDRIWTILVEFGDQIDPDWGGEAGPLHNQIAEPDRTYDNSTIWEPNFNQAYYQKLLFDNTPGVNSVRNYYLEQSGGLYTVNGDVTAWVNVPYNESYYGDNDCGDACVWPLLEQAGSSWYDKQVDAGRTPDEINADLAKFDIWDRYDYDGDSNFNEPDGYIDHFQTVHAGAGEETGGGAQGEDAIWSHRWYAFQNLIGLDGPVVDGNQIPFGGFQVGDSDFWIGDYTIEPENGGVGVFAHEFAHDLGIDDFYDTSGGENSTGFWTLMSSGSYGNNGKPEEGIGNRPGHMSALEKLILGWTETHVVDYGDNANVTLGPSEYPSGNAQTLIVQLPNKVGTEQFAEPYAGTYFYYSDSGDSLDNTMERDVTLPITATVTAKINYDIEEDWDYLYLTVNGNPVETNLSTDYDPNGQNFGHGITGSSGGDYVDLMADLSAYAGQEVTIGFRYWTDGFVAEPGAFIDEIAISGQPTDGAESDPGWSYDGFQRTDGMRDFNIFHAYIAEFRTYWGYDKALKKGAYNFGFGGDYGNWVEHFPYQDGLLVHYYNEEFDRNDVAAYCDNGKCGGRFLPVDAHPELLLRPDGDVWRARVQSWDSTFGLEKTPKLCLHLADVEKCYPKGKPRKQFNDMRSYWTPPDPSINHNGWIGVDVPKTGTTISVDSVAPDKSWMNVSVEFAAP